MIDSKNSPNTKRNSTWKTFLIWSALALLIRWQLVEPRWIPSGSMLPTLEIQDRILIEKIRPRITRNNQKHLEIESVVVFQPPENLINAGYDSKSALIKRIVGVPGDQIEVHNGNLYRNGDAIEEPWIEEPINYEMNSYLLSANELWVLGDNRNNSLDSHIWGPLPEENIIGTAIWRYWPIKKFGPIRFPTQKKIG